MTACGPLCAPMTVGVGSLPLPAGSGRCGPVMRGVAAQGFRPFLHGTEGRKEKRDKSRGRRCHLRPVTSSRSAGRYGVLRCIKSGVKIPAVLSPLRSRSQKGYSRKKKTGVTHGSVPALLAEKRKQPVLPAAPSAPLRPGDQGRKNIAERTGTPSKLAPQ